MRLELLKHAAGVLRANALRSMLTVASVVTGVAAVIAMVTIGAGASRKVEAEVARLGLGVLTVRVGQSARGGKGAMVDAQPFDYADVEAIRGSVDRLRAIVPVVSRKSRIVSGRHNILATVLGTESDYLGARSWALVEGRAFTAHEMHVGSAVCLIGATVRDRLFGDGEAIGQFLRIGSIPCTVVGVLARLGQTANQDDSDATVVMPFDAYQRRVQGSPDIATLIAVVRSGSETQAAVDRIEALLRERRRLDPFQPNDFAISDMRQIAEASASTARTMAWLLASIAAVLLFVGGLGITNVMLMAVSERRREIAIRMAIGALPKHVLQQFLSEAIILACIGSGIGALVGMSAARVLAPVLDVPFVLSNAVVWSTLVIALAIGIVFGYVPARRAASLDPIVGLRQS